VQPTKRPHKQRPFLTSPQIEGRDASIQEGRSALLAEQRRAKELETHKFVLTHKVAQVGAG
jgi:hypothetical protein